MTVALLGVLLALHVVLRALPIRGRSDPPLTAVECAFLRAGTKAAIMVVHARPASEEGRDQRENFDQAVAAAGDPLTGRWGIARNRGVRRAALAVRERLIGRGLMAPTGHFAIARCLLLAVPVVAAIAVVDESLEFSTLIGAAVATGLAVVAWFAPRRSIAGWRVLRAERRRYVQVTLADTTSPDSDAVAMLVALHGRTAVDVLYHQSVLDPPWPDAPPIELSADLIASDLIASERVATPASPDTPDEAVASKGDIPVQASATEDSPVKPRRLML